MDDAANGRGCGGVRGLNGVRVNLAGGGRVRVSQSRRNSGQACTGGNEQRCVRVPRTYGTSRLLLTGAVAFHAMW